MLNQCHIGDCRALLRNFVTAGVRAQMCVTSPPYWGLRDYGVAGQIGLEPTLGEWIETVVDVMRCVRDVLADDGTLWLNLGDAYAGSWGAQSRGEGVGPKSSLSGGQVYAAPKGTHTGSMKRTPGLKPKDLMGQPWRVAFALQDDGWYLRQDIIWHKPNPMPESIADRCTKAHEYLFLLSKSERYYYDADAIMERSVTGDLRRPYGSPGANMLDPRESPQGGGKLRTTKMPDGWDTGPGAHGSFHRKGREKGAKTTKAPKDVRAEATARFGRGAGWRDDPDTAPEKRNRRSVWTIPSEPFDGAHFATFPRALIDPCILAGSRSGDVVLDPFLGSGTTAEAAEHLGRQWIGCELQADYMPLQQRRLAQRALPL